jgi:hypothetical protein
MTTLMIPAVQVRGVEQARQGLARADAKAFSLFARSLAHEVLAHCEVPELAGESSWNKAADVWARAAWQELHLGGPYPRDAAVEAVLAWLEVTCPIQSETGLKALGWQSWCDAIRQLLEVPQGQTEEGVDLLAQMLEDEFNNQSVSRVTEAIPDQALVEMSFIPNWDGVNVEDLVDQLGLRYGRRVRSVASVEKNQAFARMLMAFNVSLADLTAAVEHTRPDEAGEYLASLDDLPPDLKRQVQRNDPSRAQLLQAGDLITVVENADDYAVPNVSFQARLRDLIAQDPARPMTLIPAGSGFHAGLHDGMVNGAGHMDTFNPSQELSIDLARGALISEDQWRVSPYKLYWHVKSAYRVSLSQSSGDQMDVIRVLERIGRG